jgi:outer membrane protein assembly factor BamB
MLRTIGLSVLLAAPAAAQEWTRFRGPNGTGVSEAKGLPATWTEKDFRWRVAIPGESHSQPVIWGDKLFLESAADQGRKRMMVCVAKADGKILWTKEVPSSTYKINRLSSYASSTPAVDAERVYGVFVSSDRFLVRAWDHAGKDLWSADLGVFAAQHGHGASPMLVEDKLVVTNDQDGESFIVALDVKTGKVAWKSPRRTLDKSAAYSTPCLLERPGSSPELLTTSQAHGIASLDPKTGKLLWEAKVFDKRAVSSPVVAGNLVLGSCGSGGGGIYLSAVKLGGKGEAAEAWKLVQGAGYVPTPVVQGARIFLVSDGGVASCLKAESGEVVWQERLSNETFYASPVLADGKLYFTSVTGTVYVVGASDSYQLLGKNPLGEGKSHSTPCIDGNRMYIKTFTHLLCLGAP